MRPHPDEAEALLDLVRDATRDYLASLKARPARPRGAGAAAESFAGPLPEDGVGAEAALRELIARGPDAAVHSAGPRYFHFVIGGSTPAAHAADWFASTLDQLASAWVSSPLGVRLEQISLEWLKDLFGLPASMFGVMTTGAMMANYTGLAAARQWWGERQGVDTAQDGIAQLPPMQVLTSGHVHATIDKALAMLGVGRRQVRRFARDAAGHLDEDALRAALQALDGAPAVLVANAGEVNTGAFDPIETMAALAHEFGCWLHVDGAFGLFARTAPETAALARGVERADSVTVDGHKWLNVPYDCGFAFVRDRTLLAKVFALVADYLPDPADPRPMYSSLGPESSRRARALAVWATLRAYGRSGVRAMVEEHLRLARRLAARVDEAPDLERLAPVPLNIVCFRYNPGGLDPAALDAVNEQLAEAVLADGRVYVGATRFEGVVALRPAIVNWRTDDSHIDELVDVVRTLGAACNQAPED